ncbi:MAG: xanthine dehydrogenase family protein molybdopterin-binding subunit [Acidimicrobiales bacterium]
MSHPTSPIGERCSRLEDRDLVRGAARFVADVPVDGALSVAFVRCPVGHARVRRLSLEKARAVPGVVGAFGPDDLDVLATPMPPMNLDPAVAERTLRPLTDEPRFAGDAVAVVIAENAYVAADAVAAVDVDYEELPVVMTAVDALGDGAPLVHRDVSGNRAGRFTFSMGDTVAAFGQADVVVGDDFESAQVYNAAIEPRGVIAQPGGDGDVTLTMWVSTQAPQVVRRVVAKALGLSTAQVRVITPNVGGGFGPKGRPYPEAIAVAALARELRRPCRWEATRQEDMQSTYHGHGTRITAEVGARSDGTLLGLRARVVQDVGAYLLAGLVVPRYAAEHLVGPYRLPAAEVDVTAVYTNKAALSPVRGGGREQGVFAIERLMDRLARRLGIDPVEVRRRNTLGPEDFPHDTGYPQRYGGTIVYDSGDFTGLLAQAVDAIGYHDVRGAQPVERDRGVYRGVAVALFAESTAMGKEGARVDVGDDGTVFVAAGSADTGQGHATMLTQICAAHLHVGMERVHVVTGDTGAMGVGTGTFASRFAVMAGNATALAAEQTRQRAVAIASELLDVTPTALRANDGVFSVAGDPDRCVTLGEVARAARDAGLPLGATHIFAPEKATTYAGGAHAAVVHVDIDTGEVTVERYVVVHDSGTIINPTLVEGQLHGGVALGLGEALGESMDYNRQGRLLTDNLDAYFVPRARHVPRIDVIHHPCPSPNNPVGIKGVGENGTMGAIPAIIGAVEDALAPFGVELREMPIRAERIVELIYGRELLGAAR